MSIQEITYINKGEIYKKSEPPMMGNSRHANSFFIANRSDGGKQIVSNYFNHSFPIPKSQYEWFGVKRNLETGESSVKNYYKSEYFAKQTGGEHWYDVSDMDICPSIGNILSIGVVDNEIDVFFDIKDANNMQDIADYYKLAPPLNKEEAFNTAEHNWNCYFLTRDPIISPVKMGTIKFIDGIPNIFKYYRYVPS